jgi:hypothetical protein
MMRKLFMISFMANLILLICSLAVLPSPVAVHFGQDGIPNSWWDREFQILIFLGVELPLFFLFLYTPAIIEKYPRKLVSLPHRDFWLRDENKQKAIRRLSSLMWDYGIALYCFLFGVGVLTVEANLATPVKLNEKIFFVLFIAFLIYTAYWFVKLLISFRIPKGHTE